MNDQLRSLISREFPNYIPVPSLAESSAFSFLCFCSPIKSDNPSSFFGAIGKGIKKAVSWPSNLSQAADSDSTSLANFVSLGFLFEHFPKTSDSVVPKEEPVFIHGQVSGSKLSGGMQVGMLPVASGDASGVARCDSSASFENKNVLNLGTINKSYVPYKEVSYWLKRVTPESSPELFREAKKRHLYVIYEVLTAEHLRIEAAANSNMEGGMNVMVPKSGVGVKGSGTLKRNKDLRFSRPKSMGRYPFAYKCGRVRVKKNKRHLGLVGLKKFYKPFQVRDQNNSTPDQSRSSSREEDISNDELMISMETDETENEDDCNEI